MKKNKKKCSVCHQNFPSKGLFPLMIIRESIWSLISKEHPETNRDGYICNLDYKKYKLKNLNQIIEEEKGSISSVEHEVIESLGTHDILSENIHDTYQECSHIWRKASRSC